MGLPEGRGRPQGHGPAPGRAAGGLVLTGEPQVPLRAALHRDRLHQRPAPGDQGRDAGRPRGRRRPAGRVRVLELPEHERRAGAGPHRPAPGRDADVRRGDHVGHAESVESRRAPDAADTGGRRAGRAGGWASGRPRRATGREDWGGRLQDRRQLHLARHRHGRHILVVESGQNDARGYGRHGGGQAGHSRTSRSGSSSTRIRTSITPAAWPRRSPRGPRS